MNKTRRRSLFSYLLPGEFKWDNYLGNVAGLVFVVAFLCAAGGFSEIEWLPSVSSEKYFTAAAALFILTGTLWLASAVILPRKTRIVLGKKFSWQAVAFREPANRLDSKKFFNNKSTPSSMKKPVLKSGFFSMLSFGLGLLLRKQGSEIPPVKTSLNANMDLQERIEIAEHKVSELEQKEAFLLSQLEVRERELKEVFEFFEEKLSSLSEAVSDASHNVFIGALWIIVGTAFLMIEVFHETPIVAEIFCRADECAKLMLEHQSHEGAAKNKQQ